MKRWRWLAVLFVPTLLTACISPYSARPTCPPPGAMQDSEKKDMEECYYKYVIKHIKDADRVIGKIQRDDIERMKERSDGIISITNWIRSMLVVDNYPRFEHDFEVEGGTAVLKEGEVAHFVRKPGSNKLKFYTPNEMCMKKEQLIIEHAKNGSYENGYHIPEEYVKECPNLGNIAWKK